MDKDAVDPVLAAARRGVFGRIQAAMARAKAVPVPAEAVPAPVSFEKAALELIGVSSVEKVEVAKATLQCIASLGPAVHTLDAATRKKLVDTLANIAVQHCDTTAIVTEAVQRVCDLYKQDKDAARGDFARILGRMDGHPRMALAILQVWGWPKGHDPCAAQFLRGFGLMFKRAAANHDATDKALWIEVLTRTVQAFMVSAFHDYGAEDVATMFKYLMDAVSTVITWPRVVAFSDENNVALTQLLTCAWQLCARATTGATATALGSTTAIANVATALKEFPACTADGKVAKYLTNLVAPCPDKWSALLTTVEPLVQAMHRVDNLKVHSRVLMFFATLARTFALADVDDSGVKGTGGADAVSRRRLLLFAIWRVLLDTVTGLCVRSSERWVHEKRAAACLSCLEFLGSHIEDETLFPVVARAFVEARSDVARILQAFKLVAGTPVELIHVYADAVLRSMVCVEEKLAGKGASGGPSKRLRSG
jgi:hypothetical protein